MFLLEWNISKTCLVWKLIHMLKVPKSCRIFSSVGKRVKNFTWISQEKFTCNKIYLENFFRSDTYNRTFFLQNLTFIDKTCSKFSYVRFCSYIFAWKRMLTYTATNNWSVIHVIYSCTWCIRVLVYHIFINNKLVFLSLRYFLEILKQFMKLRENE